MTLKKSSTQELCFTKTDETEGFPPDFPPSIIFPLKEGNPKDHRPDVFLVSPSMCFFPLNPQGLEPCLRFTKIFESRREPVEKQGETRFKTVNLVNTGESQMA
ncbi:MAG: hypothetical protein IJI08_06790, partial [Clostridia bacterium]|nr:hypothetical protein [Clostridia bacterium]